MDKIKKILIISSDKSLRDVLTFCLDGWGYEVFVHESPLHDITPIKKISPDVIVVDSNFSSMKNDCMVANTLKEKTGVVTILTGTPTRVYAEDILDMGLDIVTRMEYDYTVLEIVNTLEKGGDLSEVPGISYQHDRVKTHNPNRVPTTDSDLDNLPYVSEVYKKYLNIEDYFLNHAYHPMIQILRKGLVLVHMQKYLQQ